MTLKKKTLIICFLTTAVCLGMIYLMAQLFLVRNLLDAEKNGVTMDMLRAVKAISYVLVKYENFTEDWAGWDDTYQFVQDGKQDYIVNNMMDETFKIQRLNMMIFLDAANNVVYAKWFDLDQEQEIDQPPATGADLLRNALPTDSGQIGHKIKGIIQLPTGPLLMVARPVVDSLREQPAKGTLIVGRYLDADELDKLSGITSLHMEIRPINDQDHRPAGVGLTDQEPTNVPVEIYYTDEHTISGNAILQDTAGADTFLLTIQEPRSIFIQGTKMLRFFLASVVAVTVLFGFIIFLLIERHILGRLLALTKSISDIKRFEDVPHNFGVAGNDEISLLADRLREIFHELRISHNSLRYVSTHDTLTDAYNRTYFEQFLQEIACRPDKKLGIVVCDIDGLKLVNDMVGHTYGDELLQCLAGVLRKSCPADALLFRMGGDEFLILVQEAKEEELQEISQRIRGNVYASHPENSRYIMPLSVSVGYTVFDPAVQDIREAIKNADNLMYREKLLRSQSRRSGLVQTLRSALEARDHNTEGHAHRLQKLAVALARRVNVSEQQMPDLQLFAEFHDVGKIGVADSILFKPGPLSPEEWSAMQKHCEIGFRIAQSTVDLAPIAGLILKHHEWWNGAGYPMGLAGEDIPMECRILSIVDAYDAMTNDRPYRKALAPAQAIKELKRCAGTQFDPYLIDRFLELLEED